MAGILTNRQVGKYERDTEIGYRVEDGHVVAIGSKSDPLTSMRSTRNHSNYSQDRNKSSNHGFGHPRSSSPANGNRRPACFFRGSEASRSSSYTQGFSQAEDEDEDEEATDVLVWSASKGQSGHRHFHRSLSDTSEPQSSYSGHHRKSSLLQRPKIQESQPNVLLDPAKLSRSDEINAEYESQLFSVAKQLEMIKSTQDSILTELSSDISSLQQENVHLKNQNEHLTLQNSHLLQVINDLSNEVELMRQIFRTRNWPLHQDDSRNVLDEVEVLGQEISSRNQGSKRLRQRQAHRFENIPLDDSSTHVMSHNQNTCTTPGDDQVSAMSNRTRDYSLQHRKKSSKSSKHEKKQGGCWRALFKRKKRKRKHETHGDDHRLS